MDKFLVIFLGLITTLFLLRFDIVDFSSFIFEYIALLTLFGLFIRGYRWFTSTERCGILLLMWHKTFECMEEVKTLQSFLNNYQFLDFLLGDIVALTGILLVTLSFCSRFTRQKQQLNMDSHTKIYNKFAIEHITHSVLETGKIKRSSTSILIIDVDKFKSFNDSYGHLLGDDVLLMVTSHLKKNIRSGDFLGRWGGDEFVIICPNTSERETIKIMKRIQESAINTLSVKSIPIRLSIGATTSISSQDSFVQIFREADRALYQVKENGRNGYKHHINPSIYQTL